MGLKFGTSGVRGLVTEMTDYECGLYAKAFGEYLQSKGCYEVIMAGDYRSSTERIAKAVLYVLETLDIKVQFLGYLPTPLLANYSFKRGAGAVMITGSHIPDDRNGIKFYLPEGEVLKADEQWISARYKELQNKPVSACYNSKGALKKSPTIEIENEIAIEEYIQRYTQFFTKDVLAGKHLVFYQHSTVGRDILPQILERLGAKVTCVGWSDYFIPVDTEAVANPAELKDWVEEFEADALISADGDCDRPLLVDNNGKIIRGDLIGILAAEYLNADFIATPVSCNSALEKAVHCVEVERTRIGSPYVIESMKKATQKGYKRVIGYEANGGFLTGSDFEDLKALPTRDALLPVLSAFSLAASKGTTLAEQVDALPDCYTDSGLLKNFPVQTSKTIINQLKAEKETLIDKCFALELGDCKKINLLDGVRMYFSQDKVLHFRPSGNAPEFRIYSEAHTLDEAKKLNLLGQKILKEILIPMAENA
ncbi:MAG: phosphomannomutase [Lentisphaeria bacterium]|nr:phosphomannomutase [Lentisphaeria bacterium]